MEDRHIGKFGREMRAGDDGSLEGKKNEMEGLIRSNTSGRATKV